MAKVDLNLSRRQFLKGSAAVAAATVIPWQVFAEQKANTIDGAWTANNKYRQSLKFPISRIEPFSLEGISGDSFLDGNEEFPASYVLKTDREIRREFKNAKLQLIKWARERCIKHRVRPISITLQDQTFDYGNQIGISITVIT